jgi:DAK2 domain fusion protein YloV
MTSLTIQKIKDMFLSGSAEIANHFAYIDELNVFPVPDGDTGSNMKTTVEGACDIIRNVEYTDFLTFGKQFSRGLLMNARGNSGVIFSQIIKGFTKDFYEGQTELTINDFINAFTNAKTVAYASVSTPIEGTILTVIRVTAENLNKKRTTFKTLPDVMQAAYDEANAILAKTPDFLTELKEAGVVDSGGYGLVCFIKGMLNALTGKTDNASSTTEPITSKITSGSPTYPNFKDNNEGFGYCCEFIMTLESKVALSQKDKVNFNLDKFKRELNKIGNSLAVVVDEKLVKVHVHSTTPNKVLEIGSQYGEFNKVKVENMTMQFLERNPGTTLETMANQKVNTSLSSTVKVIATVPSQTMANIYKKNLDIKEVINTEIHGNPSISEFVTMIKQSKSSNIIIVVDDSNVVLAAKEAISLIPKPVHLELINAKNIAASYLACLAFDPVVNLRDNVRAMEKVVNRVVVGKISRATKVVKYSHIEINKDDYIGIQDKKVISANADLLIAAKALINKIIRQVRKPTVVHLITGKDVEIRTSHDIKKYIEETKQLRVIETDGQQPTYSYYIAIQ